MTVEVTRGGQPLGDQFVPRGSVEVLPGLWLEWCYLPAVTFGPWPWQGWDAGCGEATIVMSDDGAVFKVRLCERE